MCGSDATNGHSRQRRKHSRTPTAIRQVLTKPTNATEMKRLCMYSYEDRIRAGELYIKLGKRDATIPQLGYPTKNALKGWHREYERRLDCLWAMQAEFPSTRRRRRRWPPSTISLTVAALPHDACIGLVVERVYPLRSIHRKCGLKATLVSGGAQGWPSAQ